MRDVRRRRPNQNKTIKNRLKIYTKGGEVAQFRKRKIVKNLS